MLQCNVGGYDRVARIILGIVLIGVGWQGMTWWLAIVGAIILVTGLIRWCALYSLMGISTVKKEVK